MNLLKSLHDATPQFDRIVVAASVPLAAITAHINEVLGVIVALLTIAVLVPRVILGWSDFLKKRKEEQDGDE